MKKLMLAVVLAGMVLCQGCNQPWQTSGPSSVTRYTNAHGAQLATGVIIEAEATYPWTTRSKWLCGAMIGLHYLDYETSRRLNFGEATGTGGHFDETSLWLDDHPSDSDVALLKGGAVLATVLLAEIFPEHRDLIFFCSALSGGLAAGGNLRLYELHK